MSLRTPLGRALGLGAAKDGTSHWWAQRLTAVALVPLTFLFIVVVFALKGADHARVVALMGETWVALTVLLFVIAGFYHMRLAVQVVVEDYVHHERAKMVLLVALPLVCVALGTACVFAVLKLAFAG
ncbi:MAG: succinate dehydrogenase, hydrophobic membrane anchor protein [Proteobacteria bacterium]|nr:succinate dehydrogenase, hydrophobic membrane anchor protein [Pseudomonadota bacterium]